MLITKFNKMIRNRIVWAFLALIISISFVWYFQPSSSKSGAREKNPNIEGKLYGEDVSMQEFYKARFFTLGMRERAGLTPEVNELLRDITWKRIAQLKFAKRMGISALDEEVGAIIRQNNNFIANGVFDKERYKSIIRNQFGSVELYETFLREEITLQKLARSLESALWTSPLELTRKLANLTDMFSVEYVTIRISDISNNVDVSQADAELLFNENKETFMVPEKANVKYVEFPVTNYMTDINIEDSDITKYYEDNKDLYAIINTNDESETTSYIPIDEVRDEINLVLKRQEATWKAKNAATDLVITLAPDRYGISENWETVLKNKGMTCYTTELFSATGQVAKLNVDITFNIAAFKLEGGNSEKYFSDAVTGNDAVYVLAANDKQESRIPDFDEVIETAMNMARRDAELKTLTERGKQIKDHASESLKSGSTFAEAVADFDLDVMTTGVFTVYGTLSDELDNSDIIIPGIISLEQGDVTDLLEIEDGLILGYIAKRAPGDSTNAQIIRPQLISSLDRYRAEILLDDWSDYLLTDANFEDITRKRIRESTSDLELSDSDLPEMADEQPSMPTPPDQE